LIVSKPTIVEREAPGASAVGEGAMSVYFVHRYLATV
jgi:hypothetical protein